ncbi:MAG: beta galactosidase jelly roll domain-containing protein [Prolixibacteraceae bacterium]|nr:beta galactosidase jelly roll domain-containing protein [Prolixibacteraceae bacterium]
MKQTLLILFVSFLTSTSIMANVKIPHVLSSNMVLQRNTETNIWGWADSNERITITFRGNSLETKANKQGEWLVKMPTGKAGGPYELSVKGKNRIILENILVGDVWVCSGQSNMEWPLIETNRGPEEVKNANYPEIRLFNVEKNTAIEPANNTAPAKWRVCNPETVASFSAVGFHFGKNIHIETGVPVGLISSNWGGTIIETWISHETAEKDPFMAEWAQGLKEIDVEEIAKKQKEVFDTYQAKLKEIQNPDYHHSYIEEQYDDKNWKVFPQPQLWETQAEWETFDGVAWYRKKVKIPESFNTKKASIWLARIDDSDITWINGVRVGETYNQYNHIRTYKIPEGVIRKGENTISIRVEDYSGGGGFHGSESEMYITDGTTRIDIAGKWKIKKDVTPTPKNPEGIVSNVLLPNSHPTLLYNGMIHPIINHAIKGAIWYQGESNANSIPQAERYERQMRLLINDWREKWNNPELSFYMVQLANYRDENQTPGTNDVWPYLREAQANVALDENVEMACIIDIGEADDIHPRNKTDVGYRLALNALHLNYNQDVTYNGPRYLSSDFDGNTATITLNLQGSKLVVKNKYGYINGFAVAGSDKVFHYAQARKTADNKIKITSHDVKNIEAVRYLWDNNPGVVNLYNEQNLPAEPFRTDGW